MAGTPTTRSKLPIVSLDQIPNVPVDMNALANAVDLRLPFVSTVAPPMQAGLVWTNPTTGATRISTGTAWIAVGDPLGYISDAVGGGQVDAGGSMIAICSISVPVIAARRYRVTAYAMAQQITSGGSIAKIQLIDDQSDTMITAYSGAMPVGGFLCGTGVLALQATTTRTASFSIQAQSLSGALRFQAGRAGSALLVEDMGT